MRKKTLKIALITLAIAGSILVLGSWRSATDAPCKESMDQCCKKKSRGGDATNNWEFGTGQFFSSSNLN